MNKTFSIASVDLFKICNEIEFCKREYDGYEPYIFMSENTLSAIESATDDVDFLDPAPIISKGINATYSGYKMFINNDLQFGIVEIR